MKFIDLFNSKQAQELDCLTDAEPSSILTRLHDPDIAIKVMQIGLWFSYQFNRYTIPSYVAHVFQVLTAVDPVDDKLGPILAGVMGAIKGELYNNNIYGNPRECHCHYLDMLTAYLVAGGDKEIVQSMTLPPVAKRHQKYKTHLHELLKDKLATFVLLPAIEKTTPKFFETVVQHLSREPRFDHYRQFAERHIELDRGEHSSATMDWLDYVVTAQPPSALEFNTALAKVINVMSLSSGRKGS